MLNRQQLILLVVLFALPVIVFAGVGAWTLWETGRYFWIWWTLPVFWGVAGLLLRRWKWQLELPLPELNEKHWTPRDYEAAKKITEAQNRVNQYTSEQLLDPQFYTLRTQEFVTEIARIYHPKQKNPLDAVSIVELLAAIQFASEDLERWFRTNIPGSHLITIGQWKLLQQAPAWWNRIVQVGWVASIAINPLNLTRYVATKLTTDPLSRELQQNMLGVFYMLYLRQLGYYLIELQSGRLRGGSEHYRKLLRPVEKPAGASVSTEPFPATGNSSASSPSKSDDVGMSSLTIAVIGQVKAGKSSLINCLLENHQAAVDVLPQTRRVQRHQLSWPDAPIALTILDTTGYADSTASPAERQETRMAAREADLLLIVLDARSPARQSDLAVLDDLSQFYQESPELKPAATIAVLNHVDALSPAMEWAPPYDLTKTNLPKVRSITQAGQYNSEVLGHRVTTIVPVCADHMRNRQWNIQTGLVPVMAAQLDQAHAVGLVRLLHGEVQRTQWWQILTQLQGAGQQMLQILREGVAPLAPGKNPLDR